MYGVLEKRVFFCPELSIVCSSLVPLDCYLAALYYFFHSVPSLGVCNTGSFFLQALFSKPSIIFVTFWDTSHFKSILWEADSIRRERIPTSSYRTCVSILSNPAVSFPMLIWGAVCSPGLHARECGAFSEVCKLQSQMASAVYGLVKDAATKSKMPQPAIQLFLHKQQF